MIRSFFVKSAVVLLAVVIVIIAGLFIWPAVTMPNYQARVYTPPSALSHSVETGWGNFAGDPGATQYSPVDQITPENVRKLRPIWVYRTGDVDLHSGQMKKSAFEDTSIIAGNSLIVCTPWNRVIALDPVTGAERWSFDPDVKQALTAGAKYVCRGVADWHVPNTTPDRPCAERLLLATLDFRLIELDAKSGQKCSGFGEDGQVQVTDEHQIIAPSQLQFTSPPVVVNGVLVVGLRVMDGGPIDSPHGIIRAFDALTGVPKWQFDPIPKDASDPAWASWHQGIDPQAPLHAGGANPWADLSVDEARDLVFIPTTSPSGDFWGGFRPGDDRYADSVLAIQASSGKLVWNYQTVHHNLFDYDLPASPLLTDLTVAGHTVPAALQLTKMGLIFAFNRVTGEPLFPIEERPVPQTRLPGEWSSPTQPIPATMPSIMPIGANPEQAWGFTPWDKAVCQRAIDRLHQKGTYAPPDLEGRLVYPGVMGGGNLGQRAYDPKRKLLIANATNVPMFDQVKPRGDMPAAAGDTGPLSHYPVDWGGYLLSPLGAPCIAPPWGVLTAIDVEQQKIVWQVPLGSLEKLGPLPVPLPWGTPSRGGPIVTGGGVIFIAGTMDNAIRAFETATGKELWKEQLPAGGQATPMTYMAGGKQYLVIAAGGHSWMQTSPGDYVIAFALE